MCGKERWIKKEKEEILELDQEEEEEKWYTSQEWRVDCELEQEAGGKFDAFQRQQGTTEGFSWQFHNQRCLFKDDCGCNNPEVEGMMVFEESI